MPNSAWTMTLVGVIYTATAGFLLMENQPYKAVMFTGYVIAQIGLVLDITLRP